MLKILILFVKILFARLIIYIKDFVTYHFWKKKSDIIMDEEIETLENNTKMFEFRPYQLIQIGCNRDKNGIMFPTPRSGHRIVCNEGNLYSFGGFNPDYQRQGRPFLFAELWKFNKYREHWSLVLNKDMPKQLASNAVILEGEIMMVN